MPALDSVSLLPRFLLVALLLLNSGCGKEETSAHGVTVNGETQGPALTVRDAAAARERPVDPGPFEFLRYRVELAGSSPEVCLVFSRPLEPDADYSAFVARESGQAMAWSASGSTLCVGGFGFGDAPTLEMREGLPAADGSVLAASETIDVEFGERPAYVGFAGNGVILPRVDADGVAIETVNVDSVTVRISRVNDRALAFRRVTRGFTAGQNEWGWLSADENPSSVSELLWSGTMATRGEANAPVTTVFPIAEAVPRLAPGAYFMEIADASGTEGDYPQPARSKRWLIITDLALTAYRGADGMDLVVRSLQSAAAVADVRVELIARNNERLATAVSDADGRLRFAAPLLRGTDNLAPRWLFAYGADNDFAVLDLGRNPVDLSELGVGGRARPGVVDGWIWFDRGIYRPGEVVHAGAMLRDAEGRALTDRPGELAIVGPNGIDAHTQRFSGAERAGALFLDFELPRAAARGQWRMEVRADGIGVFASRRFAVEDFVPQRVALELNIDDAPLLQGERRTIDAEVRFHYGAPGVGLPIEGRVRVEKDPDPFPEHAGYRFGLHQDGFTEQLIELPGTVADGEGRAGLPLDVHGITVATSVPLRLRAVVSAIEPGGRPVADDVRVGWRPADLYLGIRSNHEGHVPRETASRFHVLAVDARGNPVHARTRWSLWRNDWNYDWYRSPGGRWQWRRSARRVPIEEGVVELAGGAEAIDLPALDWGEYELRVQRLDAEPLVEASTGFRVGWGRQSETGESAPDRIEVSGPVDAVQIGERARIAIVSPWAGRAQLVIASDRVLHTQFLDVVEGGNEVTVPVTEQWGAGAYALVNVFTKRDAATRPVPRRGVGVAWLPVDVATRTLTVSLGQPERVRPREPLALNVQIDGVADGEAAWITLAAVDEGILALTRFVSPDPLQHYFGKLALGIDLLDDYGRLLDPNQGAAAPVRAGGDQIGGAGLTVVPTRTVALFHGPVPVQQGRARVELDVPDFNGSLRLMAVAWSTSGLGMASESLSVRDPLVAELILPRFLAPGDEAQAMLSLDNVEAGAGAVTAQLIGQGGIASGVEQRVNLDARERVDQAVPVVASASGVGHIELNVTAPGFAVQRSYPMQTRSAWLPATTIERRRLAPGEQFELDAILLSGYVAGSARMELSVAASPLDVAPILASLRDYPHQCSEQMASRALPMLYGEPLLGAAAADATEHAGTMRAVLETLLARQAWDGSFGLWRVGDGAASPWMGVYLTDYLTRAARAGASVPEAARSRALDAIEPIAAGERYGIRGYDTDDHGWWGPEDSFEQSMDRAAAYALYVLAREGRGDPSRARWLHDSRLQSLANPLARAHLGVALAMLGDRARAHSAFSAAEETLGRSHPGDWYQSPLRDLAGVLAMAAEAGMPDRTERLLVRLTADLPDAQWMTTQEKAFVLLAARALAGGADAVQVDVAGDLQAHGPRGWRVEQPAEGGVAGTLRNAGAGPIWVTHRVRGETLAPPAAVAEGIELQKRFFRVNGEPLSDDSLLELRQGDRLLVSLEMRPAQQRSIPGILVDLLPAGFEIEAVVQHAEAEAGGIHHWLGGVSALRIAEVRDDRLVAAIDLQGPERHRVAYVVRAVTPGSFALPGASFEDMYRPDVRARTSTGRIRIAPAP